MSRLKSSEENTAEEPIWVPYDELEPETLRNLAEEFVTRDGTDYGAVEKTLEQKVEALMLELRSGDARIGYGPKTGNIEIVARRRVR